MDDIIVLFGKPEHLQQFLAYIKKLFSNIRFSLEAEKNGDLTFLDIKIYIRKWKVCYQCLQERNFHWCAHKFFNFFPLKYKLGLS